MEKCNKCPICPFVNTGQIVKSSQTNAIVEIKLAVGYVRNNHTNKVTGGHFNKKGQKQNDMTITIIEKLHNTSIRYRKQREKMYITRFNTKYKGMNRIS